MSVQYGFISWNWTMLCAADVQLIPVMLGSHYTN